MSKSRPNKPQEMRWWDIKSGFQDLVSSKKIQNQIKSNTAPWQIIIENLKPMMTQAREVLETLNNPDQASLDESKEVSEKKQKIIVFLDLAKEFIAKGKALAESLEISKLYYVDNQAAAIAINSSPVVIIYKDNGIQRIRVVNKKLDNILDIPLPLDEWKVEQSPNNGIKIIKVRPWPFPDASYSFTHTPKGKINQSEDLDKVVVSLLKKKTGIQETTLKETLTAALNLASNDLPILLAASAELPFAAVVGKKLDQFKAQVDQFNLDTTLQNPLFLSSIKQASKFIEKSEKTLQAALQEEVYTKYFTNQGSEDPPIWISEAGKAFIHVKKIMQQIKELQKKAPENLNDAEKIAFRIKQASELARIGKSLLIALNNVKKNLPLLNELPEEMMQHGEALAETAIGAFDQVVSVIGQIKKSKEPLLDTLQALETAILESAKSIPDEKLRTEATTAVNNINALLEKLASIDKKTSANLLEFTYNHFSDIQNALTSLPKILDILSKLSLEEAEKMTSQIEGTLQTIVGLGQSLEKEFFLKPEYFTSGIQTTFKEFQKKSAEIKVKIEEARADPLAFVAKKLAEHGVELSSEARENIDEKIDSARKFLRQARNELLERLDPDIYEQYFSGNIEMKEGEDNPHWIAQAGKSIVVLEKIIEKIDKLNEEPETTNPFELLELRKKQIIELALANKELLAGLRQIKLNKLVSDKISSLKSGAITPAEEKAKLAIGEIKTVLDSLETMTSQWDNILKDEKENFNDSRKTKDDKVFRNGIRSDIKYLLGTIHGLDGKFEKFRKSVDVAAGEKPNLLKFAYQNFSDIKDLLTTLPIILEKLNYLSTEEAKKMAIEINDTLKKIVLLGDKLEIQLCLKEGSLTENLKPTMDAYRTQVRKLGYDLSPENCYPYAEAVRTQRENLLKSPDFAFQRELIKKRMEKPKQAAAIKSHRDQEIKEEIKKGIGELVREHIVHLKTLNKNKDIDKKIKLLEKLIKDKKPFQLEERLAELKRDKETSQYAHLLYQGNTGKILKRLENKSAPREAIFSQLSTELLKFKRQRGKKYYFYQEERARLLEEKIQIFEKLQILVETNNLQDALGKLKKSELSILERYDASFIENLKLFEKEMHSEHRPKTILGTHSAKNNPVTSPEAASPEQGNERKHAINLIDEQIKELRSSNRSDKQQKVAMLQELMLYLSEKENKMMSLERAILKLKTQPQYAKDIYLLFEGSLGKTMKAAQSLTITRAELIHRLDIEINNMKQQRYTRLYLFSNSRKQNLDKHIESLEKIKSELQTSGKKSVADIVNGLNPSQKATLKRYEPDLVKELEKFKRSSLPNIASRNAAS
jgi:hypothetical protein